MAFTGRAFFRSLSQNTTRSLFPSRNHSTTAWVSALAPFSASAAKIMGARRPPPGPLPSIFAPWPPLWAKATSARSKLVITEVTDHREDGGLEFGALGFVGEIRELLLHAHDLHVA